MEFKSYYKDSLNEVKMSPSVLKQFAKSESAKNVTVGCEFEMYIIDAKVGAQSKNIFDMPYEHVGLDDVEKQFFQDYSDGAESFLEKYNTWVNEVQWEVFLENEGYQIIASRIIDDWTDDPDNDVLKKFKAAVEADGGDFKESIDHMKQVVSSEHEMETHLEDRFDVDFNSKDYGNSVWEQFYDAAYNDIYTEFTDYPEEYGYRTDIKQFLSYEGVEDPESFVMQFGGSWGAGYDLNTAEVIANDLEEVVGATVKAYDSYASDDASDGHWVIEPDGSVTGHEDEPEDMGVEIKSPPLPWDEFLEVSEKFFDWARENAYTNGNTGLHINMSIPKNIDLLKLVLFAGGEKVAENFGRKYNNYATSNMREMRSNLTDFGKSKLDTIKTSMDLLKAGMNQKASSYLNDLAKSLSSGRHVVTFKPGYVEFRAAGNDYLNQYFEEVMNTVYRFGYAMVIASDPNMYVKEYAAKLSKLFGINKSDELNVFINYSVGQIDSKTLKTHLIQRKKDREELKFIKKFNLDPDLIVRLSNGKLNMNDLWNIMEVSGYSQHDKMPIIRYLTEEERRSQNTTERFAFDVTTPALLIDSMKTRKVKVVNINGVPVTIYMTMYWPIAGNGDERRTGVFGIYVNTNVGVVRLVDINSDNWYDTLGKHILN